LFYSHQLDTLELSPTFIHLIDTSKNAYFSYMLTEYKQTLILPYNELCESVVELE
ncbi:hypothetical protein BSGG_5324, partial [Bacteroides sp. D2]